MASQKALSNQYNGGFQAIIPGTSQKLSYTGTSAQSSAVATATTLVRVVATTACFIKIGTNPTAVADTSMYLPAGIPEYFGIEGGQKIAAIQLSSGGDLYITEGA